MPLDCILFIKYKKYDKFIFNFYIYFFLFSQDLDYILNIISYPLNYIIQILKRIPVPCRF